MRINQINKQRIMYLIQYHYLMIKMRIGCLTPYILKLDTRLSCVDSYRLRPLYCSFRRLAITIAILDQVKKRVSLCARQKRNRDPLSDCPGRGLPTVLSEVYRFVWFSAQVMHLLTFQCFIKLLMKSKQEQNSVTLQHSKQVT